MSTKSTNLILLEKLQGKLIVHESRLFRVDIYTKKQDRQVADVKPTFLQNLFGAVTTTKLEEYEDIDCIYLVDLKDLKTQKCMSESVFIKKVILQGTETTMSIYHVNRKLREFFNLKSDFYMIYDLVPKEKYKKVENV